MNVLLMETLRVQYDKDELIETLTRQEDSSVFALLVSSLMSEADLPRSTVEGGN